MIDADESGSLCFSLRLYPAEARLPQLLISIITASVLLQAWLLARPLIPPRCKTVSLPSCISLALCLFWGSRSATPAGSRCSGVLMIVCFQMLIRAAPLRPGLFLIEALQSAAQLAADQLAVPTCVSEGSRSCWRRLFYRHCSRHVLLQSKRGSEKEFAYLNPHNEASVCSHARLDSSRRH